MKSDVLGLFAVPLYRSSIDPIDPITLNRLFNFEYEKSSYDQDIITHKETAERHLLDRPEFAGLKKSLQAKIDEYAYEYLGTDKNLSWQITTSWVNKAEPGGYHAAHVHSNSLLSGVLYLKTNPKSGAICFYKNSAYHTLFTQTINVDFDKTTDWNMESVGLTPKDFDVLIFPSTLSHSVMSNDSQEDRYSLAFNVFPVGTVAVGSNSELTIGRKI